MKSQSKSNGLARSENPKYGSDCSAAAWCREQGLSVEVLPALDGHGVDIVPVRTSKLTRGECADLITYDAGLGRIAWRPCYRPGNGRNRMIEKRSTLEVPN